MVQPVQIPVGGPRLEVSSPAAAPPSLAVGQEVVGRIQGQMPDGRLLLSLAGTSVLATAPDGLAPGTTLALRVVQVQPEVVLQIQSGAPPAEPSAAGTLRPLLAAFADPPALADLLQALAPPGDPPAPPPNSPGAGTPAQLSQLLGTLIPPDGAPDAEHLAAWVRDGGLGYEAKLVRAAADGPGAMARAAAGDVKGQLLGIVQRGAADAPVAQAAACHLEHIEAQQAVNLLARLGGGPYRLEVPLVTPQGLTTAVLAIDPDASGAAADEPAEERTYNVLLLLDLERFGRTRVDAYVSPGAARAVLYIEQSDALARVRAELPALRGAVRALGFPTVELTARGLKSLPPRKAAAFAAVAAGAPGVAGVVDARV